MIAPGEWLGLMGGGQLGRMFCHAAQALGYRVAVLDPASDGPAASVADMHIQAEYDDHAALRKLAQRCRAVTTEFENVPAQSLQALAAHCRVTPGAHAVEIVQDRIAEKAFIVSQGVAVAPYAAIRTETDLRSAPPTLFPGILKVARLGYDGKGQARVRSCDEALKAFAEFGSVPCVLEAMLDLKEELSVVLARGLDGACEVFPVARNVHEQGILAVSTLDTQPAAMTERATQAALAIARGLKYEGVMCVEFFVLGDGQLLVNEIAPRPHNSGHFSMNACVTSQFEQQARVMAGLPLGSTRLLAPVVMLNILGDVWYPGQDEVQAEPNWAGVLAIKGTSLHLYGKWEARRARKMGHVNCTGRSLAEAVDTANQVVGLLRLPVAATTWCASACVMAAKQVQLNSQTVSGQVFASDAQIDQAVKVLSEGGLVAFPTETVYGLGADAENIDAVNGIYRAKGRPQNHPVIVHVAPEADLAYWADTVPPEAQLLIDAFWPGPLTLILKRAAHIPDVVSGGQDSVGLRCPSHPVAQRLIRAFAATKASGQGGIAGPSANKFGRVSPTLVAHVRDEFPELTAQGLPILEGGASTVGIESTIIDLSRLDTGVGPVLLRPGHISAEQIAAVLAQPVRDADAQAPRVSGALKSHYAPRTPLTLLSAAAMLESARSLAMPDHQKIVCVTTTLRAEAHVRRANVDWVTMPKDPVAYSQALFATLRSLDQAGYERILWENVPDGPQWLGAADRLGRASA